MKLNLQILVTLISLSVLSTSCGKSKFQSGNKDKSSSLATQVTPSGADSASGGANNKGNSPADNGVIEPVSPVQSGVSTSVTLDVKTVPTPAPVTLAPTQCSGAACGSSTSSAGGSDRSNIPPSQLVPAPTSVKGCSSSTTGWVNVDLSKGYMLSGSCYVCVDNSTWEVRPEKCAVAAVAPPVSGCHSASTGWVGVDANRGFVFDGVCKACTENGVWSDSPSKCPKVEIPVATNCKIPTDGTKYARENSLAPNFDFNKGEMLCTLGYDYYYGRGLQCEGPGKTADGKPHRACALPPGYCRLLDLGDDIQNKYLPVTSVPSGIALTAELKCDNGSWVKGPVQVAQPQPVPQPVAQNCTWKGVTIGSGGNFGLWRTFINNICSVESTLRCENGKVYNSSNQDAAALAPESSWVQGNCNVSSCTITIAWTPGGPPTATVVVPEGQCRLAPGADPNAYYTSQGGHAAYCPPNANGQGQIVKVYSNKTYNGALCTY